MVIGFKAGSNAVNHSHLDVGSFVLDAKGVRWVIDLGPDDYNLPGYFGGKRWTYHRLRAEGHNTLVLEPTEGSEQDPKGSGTITTFKSSPRGVTLTGNGPEQSGWEKGALARRHCCLTSTGEPRYRR